jgi:hypothetical protein
LTLVLIILAELGSTTKLGFVRQIVSLWSIMLQGIALFVARWIVSIPFSLADFALPSMATILIVLVLQSFADGFVCRKVLKPGEKTFFEEQWRRRPHLGSGKIES